MKSVWDLYEIGMRSVWICMGSRWDMDGTWERSGLEQIANHLLFFMLVVYVLLALWWERGLWLQEHSNQAQEGTWPCGVSAWSNQVRRQPLNFDMIICKHLGILVLQGAGSCVLWSSPTQAPETYRGSVVLQHRALSNGITCLWDWKVSMHSKTYLNRLCEFNSMHFLHDLDRPISQITKKLFFCAFLRSGQHSLLARRVQSNTASLLQCLTVATMCQLVQKRSPQGWLSAPTLMMPMQSSVYCFGVCY